MKTEESKLEAQQEQLDIPVVMRLLSNENMYTKSGLHSSEISDNGELRRVSIKETSFETGFMCARKIILDALNNNA